MKIRRRLLPFVVAFFLLTAPLIYLSQRQHGQVSAAWADDSYSYRKNITITNNTTAETNVYTSVTIDTSDTTKFQSDCGDLRFTKANGQDLAYFISSGCSSASTVVHVLHDSFPAGVQIIYYYYGNSSAVNGFSTSAFSTQASNYTVGSIGSEEKSPAPIAYWKFDEGVGSSAYNSTSTTNLNATIYPTSISWQTEDQCISGKCVFVNDVGSVYQSIQNADHTALGGMSTLSVSVWIKTTENKSTQQIIYKRHENGGNPAWWSFKLQLDSLKPAFYVANSSGTNATATADTAIELNKWYLLTGVYDGSQVQIYVNASPADSTPASQTGSVLDSSGVFLIGGLDTPDTYFFHGFVDEVKIYHYARSAAQVKSDFLAKGASSTKGTSSTLGTNIQNSDALSNGLIGYWKMDESSGTAYDSSGVGTSVSNNGTTPFGTGIFGNAPTFNGSSRYFNTGASISSVQSVSFWIKPGSTTDNFLNLASGKYISASSGTLSATGLTSPTIYINGAITSNLVAGTWQFVTITDIASHTANVFEIGRANSSYSANNTQIDEVRIYNRALSPSEVFKLYNFAPGPVGHWKFDEGSGTTISDSSGNGINATWGGTGNHYGSGKFGKAGLFNGTDDYTSITNPTIDDFGTGSMTISAWIKSTQSAAHVDFVDNKGAGSNSAGFNLQMDTNYAYFRVANGSSQAIVSGTGLSAGTIHNGQWHHVTGVYSRGTTDTIYIYIDGILTGTNTVTNGWNITSSTNLFFGAYGASAGNSNLNGQIDNILLYNYARTPKQIIEDMNAGHPAGGSPIASQIGYWKLDEGVGTSAYDSSGQSITGNLGTGNSAPVWTNNGKFGKALFFDGNDCVDITNTSLNAAIDDATDYTVTAWVKPSTVSGIQTFFGERYSSGITMYLSNNNLGHDPDDANLIGTFPITANTWYHVAVSFKGSDGTHISSLYVNGRLDKSGTNYNHTTSTSNLYLGCEKRFAYNFTGLIDEVKVYNNVLTAEEIRLDYNRGASLVLGTSSDTSGLSGGQIASSSASAEYCIPGDTTSCAPPVGEWAINEGTGTTAYDSSGNGYNCALQGSAAYQAGKFGKSLFLPGATADYASCGTSFNTTNPITLEAWFNPGIITSAGKGLISKDSSWLWYTRTGTQLSVYNTSPTTEVSANYTFSPNTWYFLATSIDNSGNVKHYVNGILLTNVSGTTVNLSANANALTIGKWNSFTWDIGRIDNVKVFDYTRTPAQIAWDYNRGAPVGHWRLDDCQGTTAYDASPNGNNGTITIGGTGTQNTTGSCGVGNTAATWSNGATGKFNSSLNFDGTDDYVGLGLTIPASQTLSNGISYSAWIKTTQSSNGAVVGMDSNSGCTYFCNSGIHININSNSGKAVMTQYSVADGYKYAPSTTTINDGSWHHIVGLRKTDGTLQIFVDGRLENSTAMTSYYSGTVRSNIGADDGRDGQFFTGQIDDVRIYNYALTATQVKTIYNESSSLRFGPSTGSP